jgi:hypothetical protein
LSTSFIEDRFSGRKERVTVRQKLMELGASCPDGTLLDRNGKEIYFYHQSFDYPPGRDLPRGKLEYRIQEEEEIRRLEEKYTVIIMYAPR